jgi:HlyD family secretion protein
MKKRIIPVVFLLIAAGIAFFWSRGQERELTLRGEVEGTIYSQIADAPGKIIEMNVKLGSPVKAGDLIARLDDTDQRYALEQLQIVLEKRRLTLRSLHEDIEPLRRLVEIGGKAQHELDIARLQETIAEADIREAESKIRQIQETLNKYEIRANCDGVLISVNYNLGAMVNAGYNLADISADNEKHVVCYFPSEHSIQISYGQLFTVRFDGKEYQAEVRFIDVKSQYTPKDMQTSATKNKVSVKVKLLLPPDTPLKGGNKVDVIIG